MSVKYNYPREGDTMRLETGDELYTLRECANLTKRKESTWRADIRARRIPFIRIGRLVRIRKSDLNAMLNRGFRPAIGENNAA